MPTTPRLPVHLGLRLLALLFVLSPALGAQGVRINLAAWTEPILLDTMRQDHELRIPPERVYQAVLRAFAELDIPTGRTDGTRGIIGSERFERLHSFMSAPLSRSFDCGEGAVGAYADAFRLEIAIVAWVGPAYGGTKLGLTSVASARDISGVSRRPMKCASTGAVEMKILERVQRILGA